MAPHSVRLAGPDDAADAGRLLHDFNVEYDAGTPGPEALAQRLGEIMATGESAVLLGGDGPDGLAILRFRPALVTAGLECYLAELYVVPARRGQGLGRALMEAAIDLARRRGADTMDLNTGEDDTAARALYASLGFVSDEGGATNIYYEREL